MKFRRKNCLKIFCMLFIAFFLYLLMKKKNIQIFSFLSLYNSEPSLLYDIPTNSSNFLNDFNFKYYTESLEKKMRLFDRRLTNSQLSNILFQKQGKFTLPTLEDIYKLNINLSSNFSALPIFPFESKSSHDDRIWNQMRYVPEHSEKEYTPFKLILLYNGLVDVTNESFSQCPTKRCHVSGDLEMVNKADVILWMHMLTIPSHQRPLGQIWAIYLLESPFHTPKFPDFEKLGSNYMINWTATYRHESTLVTPYFKYTPYDLTKNSPFYYNLPRRNYALGKTKLVAWFVSNCGSLNNRLQVAEELQKYIQVDIYGLCGPLKCSRFREKRCFEMLNRDYKFYLAFENSNCRDYITEKFFLNGLSNNVIPVVMGAPQEDYERVAPPHSFIHLDRFLTIKDLATYLNFLDVNHTAYNEYFAWKDKGLVDTNSYFWCRLCMLSHEGDKIKSNFPNVHNWWFDKNRCSVIKKNETETPV